MQNHPYVKLWIWVNTNMMLKKANKAKKKQKKVDLKEIKLRPVTEVHDYTFKIKNAQKFLSKGDKVKFTIRFKGRELQHTHLGNELMEKDKIRHVVCWKD